MFTEYKFDPEWIKAAVAEKSANLKVNRGLSDLLGFGLSVIHGCLQKDPLRYRDYGPYWWALKAAGYPYGKQSDPLVADEYCGKSDVETLAMAEAFRDDYLKENIVGTNTFMLDADAGETWTLFDPDMEQLSPHRVDETMAAVSAAGLLSRKCTKVCAVLFQPCRVLYTTFVSDRRNFPDRGRDLLCHSAAIAGRTSHG